MQVRFLPRALAVVLLTACADLIGAGDLPFTAICDNRILLDASQAIFSGLSDRTLALTFLVSERDSSLSDPDSLSGRARAASGLYRLSVTWIEVHDDLSELTLATDTGHVGIPSPRRTFQCPP